MAARSIRLLAQPAFVRSLLRYKGYSVRFYNPSVWSQRRSNVSSQEEPSGDHTRPMEGRRHGKLGVIAALLVGSGLVYYNNNRCRGISIADIRPARLLGLELNAEVGKAAQQFNFLANVVEKASPSVVSIERKEKVPILFGRQIEAVASGSGFVVSQDGLVVTNAHVVGKSSRVLVRMQHGKEHSGRVLDVDLGCDLALVKIDPQDAGSRLPFLRLGEPGSLRPGEWVVAMGSPLSLSNTITAGIVSCVRRASQDLGLPEDRSYVQTDAAITIGNSGGPLVDLDGNVVGVNTLTAAPGISFAIPSETVRDFVRRANKDPETSKISDKFVIGVSMVSLSLVPSLFGKIALPEGVRGGVLVARVVPGEPGQVGGLQRGDVIVSIDGRDVKSPDDVLRAVQTGKKMALVVVREARNVSLHVTPQLAEY